MVGFTAYIDESGCDGFDFEGGSSDFLVVGAVISRTANLPQFEDAVSKARECCRKADNWTFGSFKDLRNAPAQKWALASAFSQKKCQVVAIAVHKPTLTEEGWQEDKEGLFFQASKFLVERISFACRDAHSVVPEADPRAAIVFSKRGYLRFDQFAEYMGTLKADPAKYSTNADWNHLDPDLVTSEQHHNDNSCHLVADHFAAAVGAAINLSRNQLDMFDDRFVRIWAERFYRANGRVLGNGFKVWPNDGYGVLQANPHGQWTKIAFAK